MWTFLMLLANAINSFTGIFFFKFVMVKALIALLKKIEKVNTCKVTEKDVNELVKQRTIWI